VWRMTPRRRLLAVAVAAAAAVLLAAGAGLYYATRPGPTTAAAIPPAAVAQDNAASAQDNAASAQNNAAAGWVRKTPGGDCGCALGSAYSFFVRTADPAKVVLYLDGGGACWSARTCAPSSGNRYKTDVQGPDTEGIFDFGNPRNPLAGYSVVYVPYCTADVHLGHAITTYAPGLTIHHEGYANGSAALKQLVESFPQATQVVVVGASAGSVAAPFYAGLVADRLPAAHVTSIADSSGSYPDAPAADKLLTGSAWNASAVLPAHPSLPGLVVDSAKRHPGIVFARIDHTQDADQKEHLKLLGLPTNDLPGLLAANRTLIEKAGVTLHSYAEPGADHVIVDDNALYRETAGGVALSDWLTALVTGKPAPDVG